jgi:ATP-dependent RNA helicase RhlE
MTDSIPNFASLGLHPALTAKLAAGGYDSPTPIQARAIPALLEGRDVLGLAQTGTGKTAAFGLPLLHRLLSDPKPRTPKAFRVLILAPTRELAAQISLKLRSYGEGNKLRVEAIFGGMKIVPQIRALHHGCDILVATPGRLMDHMNQGTVRLDQVEAVVFDEADQMLDLGFLAPLRKIAKALPKQRQTLLFSATMPPPLRELADEFLLNPVEVAVTPAAKTADKVKQSVIHVPGGAKRALLVKVLNDPAVTRTLVFSRTKHGADRIVRALDGAKIGSVALHGNKSQAQRQRALESFKTGHVKVLVATDIAARGIHVDNVSHVINFDMPVTPEAYVHRIGRTARAGAEGIAISFVAPEERKELRAIEKLTRQTIDAQNAGPLEPLPDLPPERDERPSRGGRPGGFAGRDGRPGGREGRGGGGFGGREGRSGPREGRPSFGDRPAFGDRPQRTETGDRPAFRPDRGPRPEGSARPERTGEFRGPRGPRPEGGARPERSGEFRGPRSPRPEGGARPERSGEFRGPRGPRPEGDARPERSGEFRGPRPQRADDGRPARPAGNAGRPGDGGQKQGHGPQGHGPQRFKTKAEREQSADQPRGGRPGGSKPFGKPAGAGGPARFTPGPKRRFAS